MSAAAQIGCLDVDEARRAIEDLAPALARERRSQRMYAALFTPGPGLHELARDDTIICRCEEVTQAEICQTVAMGADVVVIGGGIIGCASAYYLTKRGVSVILLERSMIGSEASGRNAGGVRAQCRDRRERLFAVASIQLGRT